MNLVASCGQGLRGAGRLRDYRWKHFGAGSARRIWWRCVGWGGCGGVHWWHPSCTARLCAATECLGAELNRTLQAKAGNELESGCYLQPFYHCMVKGGTGRAGFGGVHGV